MDNLKCFAGKRMISNCCFCGETYVVPTRVPQDGLSEEQLSEIQLMNFEHMKQCEKHPYKKLLDHYRDLLTYLNAGICLHEAQLDGPMSVWPHDEPRLVKLRDDVAGKLDVQG